MSKFICQLYGLRNEIEKDPYTCFMKIKKIGFDAVQIDGMRGQDPATVKDALKKANLEVASMHIKHNRFIYDVDGIMKESDYFNCKEIYLKYIEDEFQVEAGYKFTKYALIKAAKKLKKAGFEVGFHSPEYDFNTLIDGQRVMDYICAKEDGVCIHPEPDTYWLSVAGINPLCYMQQYADHILTIHMKDINMSKDIMDIKANLEPCGEGDIDFESILRWGEEHGVRSYAIEQDYARNNIYKDMEASLHYLMRVKKDIAK